MKELKFKSNINCTGCLSKVKPILDAEILIEKWEVDLQDKDRILVVKTEKLNAIEIKKQLASIGFTVEEVSAQV